MRGFESSMEVENENTVPFKPVELKAVAGSVSRMHGNKGAIVITSGDEGIRIGMHGLDTYEAKEALCVAMYYIIGKALEERPF